jgi:hypothetical protein
VLDGKGQKMGKLRLEKEKNGARYVGKEKVTDGK